MTPRSLQTESALAILGGPRAVRPGGEGAFTWPIITEEDEQAVLEVLRRGAMSDADVTRKFEAEFAAWQGSRFAVGHNNGTAALQAAMFACRIGAGDQIICPSITYWASALPCLSLGAKPVFADIDPQTLCLDPDDIEPRITPRTRAIMVVHYLGHPADMDRITPIARRHGLKIIEDTSHAQGGLYRGRRIGTLGDVAACSLMSRKSLPVGEAGMLTTDDPELRDRAIAWGHYKDFTPEIETASLQPFAGLPLGGVKGRMHQLSAAMGRVQLKYCDQRCAEIRRAIDTFWELLEGVPGLRPHRVADGANSNMAGWYSARGHYLPEELGGLSATGFARAVRAEGAACGAGCNRPLHLHPLFRDADIYGHGTPTCRAFTDPAAIPPDAPLPVSESIGRRLVKIPWFTRLDRDVIAQHAQAYRKVAERYEELLADDPGDPPSLGGWGLSYD